MEIDFKLQPEDIERIAEKTSQIILAQINSRQEQQKYAYSIKEGAEKLGISTVTLMKWKNQGIVDYAQNGRKVIIDVPGTMELLKNRTKSKF